MRVNTHGLCRGNGLARICWKQYLCALGALATAGLFVAGCGSSRPIKYYQVSYPTKTEVEPGAINTTLTVRPFDASRLYLDNRIVYGFSSPELDTYEYHRWVDPPVDMLQTALVRGLSSSGAFKAVYTVRRGPESRFLLGGNLFDFMEVDGANIVARLNYDVRLRDRKTGTIVWEHSYNHDEPVAEKSVNAFVLAMDKNLQRSVQEIQTGLQDYFRAHPVE
jgi:cholesterol transport system auxiliary component